jgi:hypothetical protein
VAASRAASDYKLTNFDIILFINFTENKLLSNFGVLGCKGKFVTSVCLFDSSLGCPRRPGSKTDGRRTSQDQIQLRCPDADGNGFEEG